LNDAELARESRVGSLEAFEQLVFRYEKRLFAFLCLKAPGPADAEDLLQQVFIKAYRYIARYHSRYAFYTWLLGIARREVAGFYRSYKGQPVEYEESMQVDERDPSRALDGREQEALIWVLARRCLSEDQYTALLLVYHEGLSVKEAARVMKRTVSSVKVNLHRGRRKLADRYRLEGGVPVMSADGMEEEPCFVSM
jgi:RNA polymerase sigma-70 factor, ECF subfamily